ncbi:Tryptophanyl-tRNA synthetase [Aspergillus sclerotialis]|uniref:Tryptophanyl-tRNA synthetase n=1 Tax=Aspergillus sclerotialis TaxID=2070753 RepID=A0A3A2Z852_9EURO|nr:Tryptophanyl-tRNA synthetase [Aspergillus sclerotialis]
MSKSHADERSRILLSDSTEDIYKKVNAALTDSDLKISYDPVRRPGVSNLLEILSHIEGTPCEELVLEHKSVSLRALKERVSTTVANHMKGIREIYSGLINDKTGYLDSVAEEGAQAACANSEVTMKLVRTSLGLT